MPTRKYVIEVEVAVQNAGLLDNVVPQLLNSIGTAMSVKSVRTVRSNLPRFQKAILESYLEPLSSDEALDSLKVIYARVSDDSHSERTKRGIAEAKKRREQVDD